jgi:dipeptidyl aminopeptidase/acylaminoacyl peptidase
MIRRTLLFALVLSSLAFCQDAPPAQEQPRAMTGGVTAAKRAFTFDDMMQLKRIGDFTVSPDGKWVTFSATDVSLADNTRKTHLWIVPIAGGESRRLTPQNGPGEDRLRFAPDGKRVLFISDRDGGSQVWVQGFDGEKGELTGTPAKATSISTEADGATWSPDGKQILFVSGVYPDCKDDACNKQRDEDAKKSKVKAKVFTHLLYRHWNAYGNGKRSHLFLVGADCDVAGGAGCAGRDLTPGDHDVPPFSLGGQDQYAFSPDGKEVAFTSNLDEVEATSTNSDVFTLSVEEGAKPKNLTEANKGSDSTPMYSADGKWIAIRSQFRAGYESDRFRLQLVDRTTGKITNLTEGFDRWVDSMSWAPDSKSLYITAGNEGNASIYQVGVDGTLPKMLVNMGTNDSPTPTADGKTIVFTRNSVWYPNEIFKVALPIEDAKKDVAQNLSHINDAVIGSIQMQQVEPFWFTGSVKHKVQGFIVKPPNFDASKKYPVKFLIHGGPQGAWGDDWSFRWNPNLFAANGYVVVMINPRGSTGYGQQFIDDVNGDWGGRPYKDLMMGLDYAEKTYPYIDKTRECALGASYGGYMADWILANTTRFACIVSHDGMFNPESAYGTTEELWFNEWEFKGTPWTNRATYRKWSPMLKATSMKTPTLVVHGQLDYRLDVSEGFQLFTALQRQKVPSKMLYFPDEGHWVLKPQNSQLWWKTVTEWVDQWTTKK